jgi:MFS family permease
MRPALARLSSPLRALQLGDAQFARLFFARLVSQFGSVMSPIAMAFGVLALTGSAQATSIVVAAQIIAQVLVLLLGGALADRGHRQRILVLADCTAAASQAVIAVLFLTGQATVPLLAALAAITGAANGMNLPTMQGFIIQVVARERLREANALLATARSAAQVLGAALAGVLVAAFGAGWTLAIEAVTFLSSAVLVAGIRAQPQAIGQPETLLRSLRDGWGEFTSHRWLWVVVLQFAFVVAGVQAFYGLVGPTLAQRLLGGAEDWGVIAAGFGVGTLLGGALVLRLNPRYPMRLAVCCVFGGALPMAACYAPSPVWLITAAAVLNGITAQTFSVLWHTAVQQHVPAESLSRVSAWDYLGSICCAPLGVIAAGWTLDHLDYRVSVLAAMVLVIVPTIAALSVRDVRMLGRAGAS